jgi:hypothetical protein
MTKRRLALSNALQRAIALSLKSNALKSERFQSLIRPHQLSSAKTFFVTFAELLKPALLRK